MRADRRWLLLVLPLLLVLTAPPAEARTRTFCSGSFQCGVLIGSVPIDIPGAARTCGQDRQFSCDSGNPCNAGYGPVDNTLTSVFPYTVVCPTIDPSPPCLSPANYDIPDDTVSTACYVCGLDDGPGTSRIGCNLPSPCAPGLEHVTTAALFGPITNCPSYLPPNPPNISYPAQNVNVTILSETFTYSVPAVNQPMPSSATMVNSEGICTDGLPVTFAGASRESWPAAEPISPLPGTVFVIHGRGADCTGGRTRLLDTGTLYPRNNLYYCVEYAQADHSDPDDAPTIQTVRVLPVRQEETGEGAPSCVPTETCEFDRSAPVFSREAAELSVPAIGDVLAEALKTVPVVGQITLVGHSQGGYILRELVHRHYDELRWHGRAPVRSITLGHPYFAKEQDPQLYAPWLCSGFAEGNLDCAVGRWLRGWDDWLATSPGHIDDVDFPQIHWVAVSGDGFLDDGVTPAGVTIESADGATCSFLFGGVDGNSVVGDTSVPIQSSLGIDEFGFYPIDALSFDGSSMERCQHSAPCMMSKRLAREPSDLPYASRRAAATGALELDGLDDALAVTDPGGISALTVTGSALTLELWAKPEAEEANSALIAKAGEYRLRLVNGEVVWAVAAGGSFADHATGHAPPAHRWSHLALVYDGGAVRLYANGVEVHSLGASGSIGDTDPAQNELWIGGREGASDFFDGRVDEIRVWARALAQGEIVDALAHDPSSVAELRARWSLDETSGNQALDSGPNAVHLALDGLGASATPLRRQGARAFARHGGALYTDGVGTFAAVSNPASLPALEVDNALTIEAWVHPRGPGSPAGGAIVSKEGEYQLTRLADGTAAFTLASSAPGWSTRATGVAVPERTWTHLALVFDGAEARLYKNGSLAFSEAATGPIGDFPSHAGEDEVWIGGRQLNDRTGSVQWFDGAIDEVRIWDVARGESEIQADTDALLTGSETGLLASWRFDDLDTEVVFDAGPGRHHAALGRSRTGQRAFPMHGPDLPGHPTGLIPDGDGDGVADTDETLVLGSDPVLVDSDGDGLDDGAEVLVGTDPNAGDTDGDGFSDPDEIARGSDPLDPDSTPASTPIPALPPLGLLVLVGALLAAGAARSRLRRA